MVSRWAHYFAGLSTPLVLPEAESEQFGEQFGPGARLRWGVGNEHEGLREPATKHLVRLLATVPRIETAGHCAKANEALLRDIAGGGVSSEMANRINLGLTRLLRALFQVGAGQVAQRQEELAAVLTEFLAEREGRS